MIRLSSPNLNYFIITGAVAMYASVLFYIIPVLSEEAATVTCNVEPSLSLSLALFLSLSFSFSHSLLSLSFSHSLSLSLSLFLFLSLSLSLFLSLTRLVQDFSLLATPSVLGQYWLRCGGFTTYSLILPLLKR